MARKPKTEPAQPQPQPEFKISRGTVTDEQVAAWEREHAPWGEVAVISVPQELPEGGIEMVQCYLRPMDRRAYGRLEPKRGSLAHDTWCELALQELWLGGDPRFYGTDPAKISPAIQLAAFHAIPGIARTLPAFVKKSTVSA